MSFIHYLFLGHFEHEGDLIRFAKGQSDPVYRPVIRRPIEKDAIKTVLQEVEGTSVDEIAFPDDWSVWLDNGYLICDKHNKSRAASNFVARLVERTQCEICDVSTHRSVTLKEGNAVRQKSQDVNKRERPTAKKGYFGKRSGTRAKKRSAKK